MKKKLQNTLDKSGKNYKIWHTIADVVELVDTLDSGSSACEGMEVQVLSSALKISPRNWRDFFLCGIFGLKCKSPWKIFHSRRPTRWPNLLSPWNPVGVIGSNEMFGVP